MPAPRALLAAIRFPPPGDDATDAELLGRFADHRDAEAFDALVRRHARLVWGVCRRALGPGPDAEDAFQATFLVLARRPGRAKQFGTAAGFLFGVARRVALKAATRANRPVPAVHQVPPADPAATAAFRELQTILDEEIGRLPDRLRLPFVLCVLEGRPRARAAAELGLNPGTLSARLARARLKLRDRLAGRGVSLAAALAATDLAATAVPPGLTATAVGAATRAGGVGANVLYLASEGWWAVGKGKLLAAAVVLAGVGGAFGWAGGGPAEPPAAKADPPKAAAEAKPAEPAKPSARLRARLMRSYRFSQVRMGHPVWAPDGKMVAAPIGDGVAVVNPDSPADADPAILGSNLTRTGRGGRYTNPGVVIGFAANTVFTRIDAGGRVNAEDRVLDWANQTAPHPKVGHVYDPDDGRPIGVVPDGKRVLRQSDRGLTEHDLTSGEPGRVVVASADLGQLAFTPDLRFVASARETTDRNPGPPPVAEEPVDVSVWDLRTGARKWSRTLTGVRYYDRDTLRAVAISADGRRVAVAFAGRQVSVHDPQRRATKEVMSVTLVFDGETGRDVTTPAVPDPAGCEGQSLSADGRLLAGVAITPSSGRPRSRRLTVWDADSGAVLKQWPGPAAAAFAPDRTVLATAENVAAKPEGGDIEWSSLGLWDLSGLGR